jgi:hypothetical protein
MVWFGVGYVVALDDGEVVMDDTIICNGSFWTWSWSGSHAYSTFGEYSMSGRVQHTHPSGFGRAHHSGSWRTDVWTTQQ